MYFGFLNLSDWLVDSKHVRFPMQALTATSAVSKPIPFVSLTILSVLF